MADGYYDFSGAFGNLNSAIDSVGRRWKDRENRQTLASLGQDIETGNYASAARKAFAMGDADTGIKLASLGRTAQQESEWMRSNGGLLGLGASQPAPAAAVSAPAIGNPNEIENRFIGTVKGAGLTNPFGLGAVAAYGKAESGFSPQNVNRSWSDPSESGQPGTAGGIMSWRAERLANLQNFAKQRGEAQPSVETQALFLAQEDPTLIPKLQQAKTPQEANQIMANAWRFAGYNREGGENARRLALTQQYAQRFGGQGGPAVAVPPQVAMTEADVRRLEAQQGNPVIDPQAPVQVAQAPATSQADLPAQGATPVQGFAVPGGQPVDASIANDPRVMNLQRALAGAPERFKPSIQSRLNILVEELKAQRQQNAPTDVQRNYEVARRQGYQGSLLDYQKELRAQTNINNNVSGEKSYDQTVGKAYGEAFVDTQKAARDASKTIGTINMMEKLIQTPGFYSGLGAERSLALNRALVSLGIKDAKAATAQEAFQALSNQVVLDAAGGSLGAQISNGDRDYINATAPNLANTPEGNKQLLDVRRKLAERQALVGKMARDYAKANNGRLDAGFDEQLSQFAEANPLFPKAETVAAPSGPPSVGEIRKGFRFKGGDPSQQSSWEKAQ